MPSKFLTPIALGDVSVIINAGSGSPEYIETAPYGSLYLDNSAVNISSVLYIKNSVSGSAGWNLLTSVPSTPVINVFGTPGNGNVIFDKGSLYAEDRFNWDSDNGILKISSNVVDSRFSFFDSNSYNSIWSLICDNGSNLFSIYNHNLTSNAIDIKGYDNSVTFNGKINSLNSTTTNASLNVPHGTAPTSPVNGDVWTTTAGMYVRVNGATVGPLGSGGGGSFSGGSTTVTVDFGSGSQYVSTVVTGLTWVTVDTKITATLTNGPSGRDIDEGLIENLVCGVTNIVAGTGFTLHVRCPNGLAQGQFNYFCIGV